MTFSANPASATDPGLHRRRHLLALFGLGVFLAECTMTAAEDLLFEQHEIVIGSVQSQTVLTGFLFDGPIAEFAVVHIDENDDRRLRIYSFSQSAWIPRLDVTLSPEVMFVDVANIAGRDRLVTYERGRLNWFDPESETQHALMAVTSNFSPPRRGEVPHVDVTQDVNGDGRDDLVVPQIDGFRVSIQTNGGTFADPVKIGTSTNTIMIAGPDHGYRYTPWEHGRIHESDYNQDGRSDLVYWNKDHFEVHLQNQHGLFDAAARSFTTDVVFDSDDLASLAAPYKDRRQNAKHSPGGKTTTRVLHTVADLNGDGITDLGIFALEGETLWNMHSIYEVHFGTSTPAGSTVFAPEVSTAAPSDGIPLRILSGRRDGPGIGQHDLGHDGQRVLMFTTMNIAGLNVISRSVTALLTRSVSLDLEFYRIDGGSYPDKPSAVHKTRIYAFNESGERASVLPAVLLGDVNGDGYSDLLVGRSRKELRVYIGVPGPELFTRRHQKVAIDLSGDEYTWLMDLNRDGKQDVLMHHPSTTEPHRVSILIAR